MGELSALVPRSDQEVKLIYFSKQMKMLLECETHLRWEKGGTCPDAPADHRFGDPALFNAITNFVLLGSSNLPSKRRIT